MKVEGFFGVDFFLSAGRDEEAVGGISRGEARFGAMDD